MSKSARAQPLMLMLTTADYDGPSICNEVYAYASLVRDNAGDPMKPGFDSSFLPVIYELPREADWKTEEALRPANCLSG